MIIKHEITMDLVCRGCDPILHLSQGDTGTHQILCSVTQNRQPWIPPEGLSVLVHYSNSFGSGGTYDTLPDSAPAWSLENNRICVTLVPEIAALPGFVRLVITFLHGGQSLSAFHIRVTVDPMAASNAPVLANYSSITGFLPAPDHAEEGQFFTAETITDHGRVASVAAVDAPASGGGLEDAVIPTASVAKTDSATTITLTDKNGTTTATIEDGKDGISPTIQTEAVMDAVVTPDGITGMVTGTKIVVTDVSGQQETTIWDGKTAYHFAQEAGYTGTEAEFGKKMAADYQPKGDYLLRKEMPAALKNPNALTVNGISYDGSKAVDMTECISGMITAKTDSLTAADVGALPDSTVIPDSYSHPATHPASMITGLSAVATSGNYGDLSGKPAIPTVPTSLKNPNALTVNGISYDGSAAVDMTGTIEALVDAKLTPETDTELVLSDNLFDKSAAISGKGWYHSSSGAQLIDSADNYYAYTELRGAGTYRTKVSVAHHSESYAKRVPLMNSEKVWIQNITGTISDTGDATAWDLEFIVTQDMIDAGAAYYTMTVHKNNVDTMMMVKDRDYPDEYIPYGYIEVETAGSTATNNILQGKTAVFLGDSICAGDIDGSEYDGFGWGGLIGEANSMTWKNYGRNGGTITPVDSVDSARWVPTQVDLALADHPNADYVIFEGGTNDADILTASGIGTFSEGGYAPADDSDFTNAFETLVLKILTAYPTAKVGYIVAQKMGSVNDYSEANNRRAFFDRAVAICEKWGIPYLDLWKNNPLNPRLPTASLFYTDGQHLTLAGYRRITPQIEAFMKSL